MEKQWSELTPKEKQDQRFERWLSPPGIQFSSPDAEKGYKERVTRVVRAFQLKEPDRVPCFLPAGNFPAYYGGSDLRTVMYDYDELRRTWMKFLQDFEMDTFFGPGTIPPARALETVDYKLYKWPGHGIAGTTTSYQCVESEWMKADEYDALINDPTDFWLRIYLPRILGALDGFRNMPSFKSFEEIALMSFLPFGSPDMQTAFNALVEAGKESMKWIAVVGEIAMAGLTAGYPGIAGAMAKAPFDTLGDTLRGTQQIMMDMFKRPDKVHEAMERLVPIVVKSAIDSVNASGVPIVLMPLHKGADAFMSVKQYETFYWPTFKKVIMAFVDEGIVPMLFAEGSYNNRLDIIKDLPRASVAWYFDQTDIFRAKEVIGDVCCIVGNVPTSLLMTGTPQQVKEHCRKLIEGCGKGGGYILAGGANIDKGDPDNLRAMMDAAKEYGTY